MATDNNAEGGRSDARKCMAGLLGTVVLVAAPGGRKAAAEPGKGRAGEPHAKKVAVKRKRVEKKDAPSKECDEDEDGISSEAEDGGEDRRAATEHEYGSERKSARKAANEKERRAARRAEIEEDEDEYDEDAKDQKDEENVVNYEENATQGRKG